MQIYTLHFDWPHGVSPERPGPHNIQALTEAEAIEAAGRLFAGQVFAIPATGFRLFDQQGRLVDTFVAP